MESLKTWKSDGEIGIVIIHGWTSYLRQIDPLAKVLNKKGYLICAPVLSGHGKKPENLEKVTWEDWERDTIESIEKIKENKQLKKVFLIGASFGGNLSILASLRTKVNGIILVSTPIFLRDHYWTIIATRFLSFFKKNITKNYRPKDLSKKLRKPSSYNYFPIKSSLECFKIIQKSHKALAKKKVPFFIIQTKKDYLVAPYSPWLMYNKIKSRKKSLYWMDAGEGVHIDFVTDPEKYGEVVDNFIKSNS